MIWHVLTYLFLPVQHWWFHSNWVNINYDVVNSSTQGIAWCIHYWFSCKHTHKILFFILNIRTIFYQWLHLTDMYIYLLYTLFHNLTTTVPNCRSKMWQHLSHLKFQKLSWRNVYGLMICADDVCTDQTEFWTWCYTAVSHKCMKIHVAWKNMQSV